MLAGETQLGFQTHLNCSLLYPTPLWAAGSRNQGAGCLLNRSLELPQSQGGLEEVPGIWDFSRRQTGLGELREKQDKGIAEHIEPFLFYSFWSAQTVRTQDTISRSTTLQGDLLA